LLLFDVAWFLWSCQEATKHRATVAQASKALKSWAPQPTAGDMPFEMVETCWNMLKPMAPTAETFERF
jgi:hypothetical protein